MNVPLYLETIFLKTLPTNFDETFHVAQACTEEGFKIGGMSRYPLVWLHEPYNWHSSNSSKMSVRMSHVRPYVPCPTKCPDFCSYLKTVTVDPRSGSLKRVLIKSMRQQ